LQGYHVDLDLYLDSVMFYYQDSYLLFLENDCVPWFD